MLVAAVLCSQPCPWCTAPSARRECSSARPEEFKPMTNRRTTAKTTAKTTFRSVRRYPLPLLAASAPRPFINFRAGLRLGTHPTRRFSAFACAPSAPPPLRRASQDARCYSRACSMSRPRCQARAARWSYVTSSGRPARLPTVRSVSTATSLRGSRRGLARRIRARRRASSLLLCSRCLPPPCPAIALSRSAPVTTWHRRSFRSRCATPPRCAAACSILSFHRHAGAAARAARRR